MAFDEPDQTAWGDVALGQRAVAKRVRLQVQMILLQTNNLSRHSDKNWLI